MHVLVTSYAWNTTSNKQVFINPIFPVSFFFFQISNFVKVMVYKMLNS